MNQTAFWEMRSAPAQWRDTSREAARRIEPSMNRLQGLVLEAITNAGMRGKTDLELERDLDLIGSTVRPRRRELELWGLIVDSGLRRLTPAGRRSIVWRVS